MNTAITIPVTRGQRSVALARRHPIVAMLGVALVVLFAKSAAGSVPGATRGAPRCRDMPDATMLEYLTGVACPPEGFELVMGYEPVLVSTATGWRYTRPESADGRCSGPMPNAGLFWNFGDACRAHDYGYDLVRFGVGDRSAADVLMYRDMKRSCAANYPVGVSMCRTLADSAHAVLWIGDTSPGFEPEVVHVDGAVPSPDAGVLV